MLSQRLLKLICFIGQIPGCMRDETWIDSVDWILRDEVQIDPVAPKLFQRNFGESMQKGT